MTYTQVQAHLMIRCSCSSHSLIRPRVLFSTALTTPCCSLASSYDYVHSVVSIRLDYCCCSLSDGLSAALRSCCLDRALRSAVHLVCRISTFDHVSSQLARRSCAGWGTDISPSGQLPRTTKPGQQHPGQFPLLFRVGLMPPENSPSQTYIS